MPVVNKTTHVIQVDDLSKETIEMLMKRAVFWESSREKRVSRYEDRFVANLFLEPSTRTKCSFDIAQKRLGMQVVDLDVSVSSMQKGESLTDTVKTLSALGVDVIVIRSGNIKSIQDAKELGCPIINAGAGMRAHPTQALLDLYTLRKHFTHLEGLKVGIVGDIEHSRVARSDLCIFKKFGIEVVFSGPSFPVDSDLCKVAPFRPFEEVLQEVDVVMLLRVQFERHQKKEHIEKVRYYQQYGLTSERFKEMKPHAIIMHPGPVNRGVEICDGLMEHPRSKIFEQMANGVFVRMAALEYALGEL